jgi:CRP-like cAMP-binding protein
MESRSEMRSGEQSEERSEQMNLANPHPIAELLDCPPDARDLLDASARFLDFDVCETVFRQGENCRGLYVAISGLFMRKAERREIRLALASVHPGQMVELGPLLIDGTHNYTLSAQQTGTILMLPKNAIYAAFNLHPPLRMHLLEELAREVSRGYVTGWREWAGRLRQRRNSLTQR